MGRKGSLELFLATILVVWSSVVPAACQTAYVVASQQADYNPENHTFNTLASAAANPGYDVILLVGDFVIKVSARAGAGSSLAVWSHVDTAVGTASICSNGITMNFNRSVGPTASRAGSNVPLFYCFKAVHVRSITSMLAAFSFILQLLYSAESKYMLA